MVKPPLSLRYAVRGVLRRPGFSAIVILVLGLAIGATATLFAVVDEVLLNALPYRDPERLVTIWESNPAQPEPAGNHIPAARENFDRWRSDDKSFEAIEAYRFGGFNLTGRRTPEPVNCAQSTAGLLSLFGVTPFLGRTLLPEDEISGSHVVVLSYSFFASHFAGSNPLSQTLLLDGDPYIVVGVLPKEFHLPNMMRGLFEYKPDLWVPLPPVAANDASSTAKRRFLVVYARLRPDVSLAQAQDRMKDLAARLVKENPSLDSGYTANVFPLRFEDAAPELKRALYVLWAAIGLVLLLACTNVASLMLVHSSARQKDIAIMAAVGASRHRLLGTVMLQGVILSCAGGLLGVLGCYGGLKAIAAFKPAQIHAVERLDLSGHTFLFIGILALFVSSLIGLGPAWLATRGDLTGALKRSQGVLIASKPGSGSRSWLVVGEVAIALTLAIGAALLIRSFQCLLRVDPGFGTRKVLTAHIVLPQHRYEDPVAQLQFSHRLLDHLRSLPRVEAVAMIDNMPLYAIHYMSFEIEGRPVTNVGEAPMADYANLTPDFFQTMGIHMRSGRAFTDQDAEASAAKVVIVNEALARKLWPNEDPVGKHIRSLISEAGPWATVVGVVGDFAQFDLRTAPRPEVFWPAKGFGSMSVAIRTRGDSATMSSELQKAIWDIDKDQPVSDILTIEQILRGSTSQARFNMAALTVFAGVGVLLAVIGVYGLVSYLVSSRMRDIGIRFALGARRGHVVLSLLRQTLPFVAAGAAIGVVLSILFSGIVQRLVFGITALDPAAYLLCSLGILIVMLVAVFIPATRAAKVSPGAVLRQE